VLNHPLADTKWIGKVVPVPAAVLIATDVDVTVSIVALNVPIFTPRVPVKFVPAITRLPPPVVGPDVDEIDVIVGLSPQSAKSETILGAVDVNALPDAGKLTGCGE
jgi:hypothetical protein